MGTQQDVQLAALVAELERLKSKVTQLECAVHNSGGKQVDDTTKRERFKQWLINEADLPQYLDHLTENGFEDVKSLKDLTKEYMDQIGIDKIGHQLKLMRLIRKMNANVNGQMNGNMNMGQIPGPPHYSGHSFHDTDSVATS